MKQYFCILFYISWIDDSTPPKDPWKAGFCSEESVGFLR